MYTTNGGTGHARGITNHSRSARGRLRSTTQRSCMSGCRSSREARPPRAWPDTREPLPDPPRHVRLLRVPTGLPGGRFENLKRRPDASRDFASRRTWTKGASQAGLPLARSKPRGETTDRVTGPNPELSCASREPPRATEGKGEPQPPFRAAEPQGSGPAPCLLFLSRRGYTFPLLATAPATGEIHE